MVESWLLSVAYPPTVPNLATNLEVVYLHDYFSKIYVIEILGKSYFCPSNLKH